MKLIMIIGGNVTEYAKHMFRVLDTDKDKKVSFQEVMLGFHNLSGSADEKDKLKLVFQVKFCHVGQVLSTIPSARPTIQLVEITIFN